MQRQLRFSGFVLGLVLAFIGAWFWFENLDEGHKRFINNLVRQCKYLPDRYQV